MVAAKIANLPKGANQHAQICAPTQSDAAEMLNVAREFIDQGVPELAAKVERGEISVSAAANIAALPKEEQREIVARGNEKAPPDKPAGPCSQRVQRLVIRGGVD